jgi:8-oxo-dGTP pyrophosphatase MutT (NUDIX family)
VNQLEPRPRQRNEGKLKKALTLSTARRSASNPLAEAAELVTLQNEGSRPVEWPDDGAGSFVEHPSLSFLTASGRVLLFRHAGIKAKAFWAPPGGGLEDGETFEQAALREARVELGLTCFTLKRVWERLTDFVYVDHPVHQCEWFFLIEGELPTISSDVAKIHRQEGILETRWWTTAEIESTTEAMFPEELASELRKLSSSTNKTGQP